MMTMFVVMITGGLMLSTPLFAQKQELKKKEVAMNPKSVLDFSMKTIDGKVKPLAEYRGDVLLIVNTASECGNTPQYETLQKLYETYREKGLRILAFPSNDFGGQEPGTDGEIKKFCSTNYKTTFDLFSKITVKGKSMHPLYSFITTASDVSGEVKWNFQKYLVDRSGKIVSKFAPSTDPMADEVRKKIELLLAQK